MWLYESVKISSLLCEWYFMQKFSLCFSFPGYIFNNWRAKTYSLESRNEYEAKLFLFHTRSLFPKTSIKLYSLLS